MSRARIRVVRCANCGDPIHEDEAVFVTGSSGGREPLCPGCTSECDEPTLPSAEQVLWQLREGTGVGP